MNYPVFFKMVAPALFAMASLSMAQQAPISALNCGATVNLNGGTVTLLANVATCAGDGLVVTGSGTLNLNGFTIRGVATSAGSPGKGISLRNATNVVIQGPGRISNFRAGIGVPSPSKGIVIQDLTLANNFVGVNVTDSSDVIIRNNSFAGGTSGNLSEIGVFAASANSLKIKDNTITGQSTAAVQVSHSKVTVTLNKIFYNGDGVVASGSELDLNILGNDLTQNFQDGVRITGSGATNTSVVVEGNDLSDNFRDGMSLTGTPSTQFRAVDNSSVRVVRYGVNVGFGWQVIDNNITRSSVDAFWNGGAGTCFFLNQFETTSPASLPVCPQ